MRKLDKTKKHVDAIFILELKRKGKKLVWDRIFFLIGRGGKNAPVREREIEESTATAAKTRLHASKCGSRRESNLSASGAAPVVFGTPRDVAKRAPFGLGHSYN